MLDSMPVELNVQLIGQLKAFRGANCLHLIKPELAKAVMEQMDIAEAESVLRHCETPFRTILLESIQPKRAEILSQKLEYRADTVGAWMTPSVFVLTKETTVSDAIGMVEIEKERISSTIYVVDEGDKLEGNIPLAELFFADKTKQLAAIMRTEIPRVFADTLISTLQNHTVWHENLAIPVLNGSGKMIGVLTVENCQKSNTQAHQELTKEVLETSSALGELYRIGLTGIIQSLSK
jgi:magnesium transporter